MPWVRLDDHFDEHPKLARVGPLGLALWVTGLAYCNRNLTDGFIPWATARSMMSWEFLGADQDDPRGPRLYSIGVSCGMAGDDVSNPFVIDLLVAAGLWQEVPGGYRVHDYDDYQPTRAQIEADREKKAAAGRQGGLARAQADAKHVLERNPSTFEAAAAEVTVREPRSAAPLFSVVEPLRAGAVQIQADAKQVLEHVLSERSSETQAKSKPVPDPVPVPLVGQEAASPAVHTGPSAGTDESDPGSAVVPAKRRANEYSVDFEHFWSAYPGRRLDKFMAFSEWQKRLKGGASAADLIAAAGHFSADCEQRGTEDQFIPHARTWLHQRRDEAFRRGAPVGKTELPKGIRDLMTATGGRQMEEGA